MALVRPHNYTAYRDAAPEVKVARRFGHLVRLTTPPRFIDYTPTAEDLAAEDWHVTGALGEQVLPPQPGAPSAGRGTGWRRA